MPDYACLPGFATAQFRTGSAGLPPMINMCIRDSLPSGNKPPCYVFLVFYWIKVEGKNKPVELVRMAFEPNEKGFVRAKVELRKHAVEKIEEGYVLVEELHSGMGDLVGKEI